MTSFRFDILHHSSKSLARVGKITTAHGIIHTPNFVAVGTNGTIKALDNALVQTIGLELMFCNTYHLLLQPGKEIIRDAGGLHRFIHRDLPIITDSGGFQVFSLAYGSVADELKSRGQKKTRAGVIKISEEGVLFRSYRDGAKFLLTPETSIQAQKDLGADIIIPFDELPPYHIGSVELLNSLERTHRWEKRSLEEHRRSPNGQAIFAVIHGGVDIALRKKSCDFLAALDFDGFAIGGSMGKSREEMHTMLAQTTAHLATKKPIHLLGIGDLESIERGVAMGIDTFDSSYPTKAARHGILLSKTGPINVTKKAFATQFKEGAAHCQCPCCSQFSLAYLHHLFKASELTALSLASIHNLSFMVNTMREMREKILKDEI